MLELTLQNVMNLVFLFSTSFLLISHPLVLWFHYFQVKLLNSQSTAEQIAEVNDLRMFVDLMKRMLKLNASTRITPCQVVKHQLFSWHQISDKHSAAASSHQPVLHQPIHPPRQNKLSDTQSQVRNDMARKRAEDEKQRGIW